MARKAVAAPRPESTNRSIWEVCRSAAEVRNQQLQRLEVLLELFAMTRTCLRRPEKKYSNKNITPMHTYINTLNYMYPVN